VVLFPKTSEIRKRKIKIKNRILATAAAPAAIPKKPKTPATNAMIRKKIDARNIKIIV
jgi:hypothetical protein